jgi:pyroglutamyl-peptidase
MRVLLTGFEPFGGNQINSSWEAVSRVEMQSFEAAELVVRQLPVSFRRVGDELRTLLNEVRPDVLIMLGQHGRGDCIEIERIAVNLMDASKTDNDGFCPNELKINGQGEAAYFSKLPVKVLRDVLLTENIPAKVSNSAGLYVCNCAYYEALHAIALDGLETKAVFVHVPKLSESVSVEHIANAVKVIIQIILN